jgi:hypothetical protein
MKYTKKELISYLKDKLSKDKIWILKALIVLYNNQTSLEKTLKTNYDRNNVGFDSFDCSLLSSLAEQYKKEKTLSSKQIKILKTKIPKYAGQLFKVSDQHKLKRFYFEEHCQTELNIIF